jgi:hypothetical protein
MKNIMRLVIVSILMIVAAPVYSASVVQVFDCQQDEDATEAQLEAQSVKWLKAAKTMKGGENIEVYLNFPMAAQMDENDFMFILIAPSFAEWGVFMDGYKGSAAAQVDTGFVDLADCPDSGLFESVAIKAE